MERYPQGVIPGGEPYDTFRIRVQKEMAFLLGQAAVHALIAVTHGGVIRTALTELYSFTHFEAHRCSAQYASIVPIPPVQVGGAASDVTIGLSNLEPGASMKNLRDIELPRGERSRT
jgi:broad specificity phosphatase PhoE